MKYLLMLAILTTAIGGFTGCASTGTTTASGDPVPGEKTTDEGRLQPGAGAAGPNASVKW
ncbi:MAG TPA: hypothetical protein VNW72_07595 [Chthoniobacterales bacterium]|jgi:hypothetical protein|nr:hypothetical protein [Chthoniobacterales bacterium]